MPGYEDVVASAGFQREEFQDAVVPSLAATGGRLVGELRVHGEWPGATVEGSLSLAEERADVVPLGLALRDVRLHATDAGPGAVRLMGGLRSGPGTAELEGSVSMDDGFPGAVDLRIRGEQLEVGPVPTSCTSSSGDNR